MGFDVIMSPGSPFESMAGFAFAWTLLSDRHPAMPDPRIHETGVRCGVTLAQRSALPWCREPVFQLDPVWGELALRVFTPRSAGIGIADGVLFAVGPVPGGQRCAVRVAAGGTRSRRPPDELKAGLTARLPTQVAGVAERSRGRLGETR